MNTKLCLRESSIDWLGIIEMAFKRKNWGKNYTLYTYGDVTINCVMYEFNFSSSTALFKVSCDYRYEEIAKNDYVFVTYHVENYTLDDFKKLMVRRIITMLKIIIKVRTTVEAKEVYENIYYSKGDADNEELIEEHGYSKDYESINNINDEDILEQCLDAFLEKLCGELNEEYDGKVEEYVNNNKVSMPNVQGMIEKLEIKGDME